MDVKPIGGLVYTETSATVCMCGKRKEPCDTSCTPCLRRILFPTIVTVGNEVARNV